VGCNTLAYENLDLHQVIDVLIGHMDGNCEFQVGLSPSVQETLPTAFRRDE
jgi:hypothetical protein